MDKDISVMRSSFLKSGAGVVFIRLVGMTAGILLTLVLARTLGPEGIGTYGYAMLLLSLVAVPVNYGWATILLRATASALSGLGGWGEVSGLLSRGLIISLCITLLASLALCLLIFGVPGQINFGFGVLVLITVILFFDQLSALRLVILRGLGHPVLGQVPEMLIRPVLTLFCFLMFVYLYSEKLSLSFAFLALFIASTISVISGGFILWQKAPRILWESSPDIDMLSWSRSAALLAANSGLIILNTQTDFLVLGVLSTTEELGYYRVVMQIALLSGFVYAGLNMIAMQSFALLFAEGSHDELRRNATYLARLAFISTLPLPLVFWLWGDAILNILFGQGYEVALPSLMWLLAAQTLSAGLGFSHTLLVMSNFERRVLPLTTFCVALNAALCFFLIPYFGLEGAAIASFATISLWNILLFLNAISFCDVDSSIFNILRRASVK